MADLPSNAFDGEDDCPGARIQIASTDESPAQFEFFIKAAKHDEDPKKRKSDCNLRLEKQNPDPANPAGPPLVTPLPGDNIRRGLGMRKSVNLAANQSLFVRCTTTVVEGEDGLAESIEGGEGRCRFTVTYFK